LFGATPTDAVSRSCARILSLSFRAIVAPAARSLAQPVTSRNASSIESGSTTGASSSRIARIRLDTSTYRLMRTGSQIASGQRRAATTDGIADLTPNTRASYEHVVTTPRLPGCPTITDFPARDGSSRTSIAA
jgi:hypothetical protein